MKEKSDTPRCDEVELELTQPGVICDRFRCTLDFARELERELNAAKNAIDILAPQCGFEKSNHADVHKGVEMIYGKKEMWRRVWGEWPKEIKLYPMVDAE